MMLENLFIHDSSRSTIDLLSRNGPSTSGT